MKERELLISSVVSLMLAVVMQFGRFYVSFRRMVRLAACVVEKVVRTCWSCRTVELEVDHHEIPRRAKSLAYPGSLLCITHFPAARTKQSCNAITRL